MSSLEDISWSEIRHAFGPADDVPRLLRELESPNSSDAALGELFSKIWHQGTVYEATSSAVPFLVDLVVNESTPNRTGILELLGAIATGTSYLNVHESALLQLNVTAFGVPGSTEFERRRNTELGWVEAARNAVNAGFDKIMGLVTTPNDIGYAALAVLARMRTRQQEVQKALFRFLEIETRDLYRAGLLLLLGRLEMSNGQTTKALEAGASSTSRLERLASGLVLAELNANGLTETQWKAVIEAICTSDVLSSFDGLPWDVESTVRMCALNQMPASVQDEAVSVLFSRLKDNPSDNGPIYTLLEILFAEPSQYVRYKNKEQLSSNQLNLIEALVEYFDNHNGWLCVRLEQYGLPDSRREVRGLLSGEPVPQLDEIYPVIASADNPLRPRRLKSLRQGDRIHSRYYGLGTITQIERDRSNTSIHVQFDEEGPRSLALSDSRVLYIVDLASYWLARLFFRRSEEKPAKS